MAVFTRLTPRLLRPVRTLTVLALLSACGSDKENDGNPLPGTGNDASAPTGDGGAPLTDAEIVLSDAAIANDLSIEPANGTFTVNGEPTTFTFSVKMGDRPLPKASWTIDNPLLGTIDQNGVFQTDGKVAGTATITVRYGNSQATTTIRITSSITQSESGVSDEQKAKLDGEATADASFKWLYPYDGTVFPRGLAGPDMQFGGGGADAMKVQLVVGDFSYTGYFKGKARAAITLPADVWQALTRSADGTMAVQVDVKKLSGDQVRGTISQKWRIAAGDLKGIIYYNTYKSASTSTGAVMRIKPGENAEVLKKGGCTVCHSVSAQGNVLAAGANWGDDNPVDSVSLDLKEDGSASVRYTNTDGRIFPFAGLTPDGKLLYSNGVPTNSPIRGLKGPLESKIYDSQTGAIIDAPSLTNAVKFAITPAFSPDAQRLAFSWYEYNGRNSKDLAVSDVDLSTNPPTFSAPQVVASAQTLWKKGQNWANDALGVVGWPSFLPDGKGLLYHDGQRFDTNVHCGGPSHAELRMVDLETKTVRALDKLNGWAEGNQSYLPHGADEENKKNYEPNVLPVPVGGYYWVIFTSRRAYGDTLAPGGSVAGSDNEWGHCITNPDGKQSEVPSPRKKLWIAAIDIDYQGKADPSHPAFYLPGQELEAGNMRAYTALAPCKAKDAACESGADCCTGFCRIVGEIPTPVCVPEPVGCSNIDESCEVDADCCGAQMGDTCINNRCASPNVFLQ